MPKLIRLYIVNVLIGFALSAFFVGLLLWFNIANLWHLVSHSDAGILAVILLWISNGIVFAGVQFAIAVMRMKDDDDEGPKGGHRAPIKVDTSRMIPVKVAATSKQRQTTRR